MRPRLSGISSADLSLLTGRNSAYLSALMSFPIVPGHEAVGETVDELDGLPRGTRVVLDPVLGCVPRGLDPCPSCAGDQNNRCDHVTAGRLRPGIQTGFCADAGGTWSQQFVAHRSQLHAVPDGVEDRTALLVEPLACAIHAVRRAAVPDGASVLVIGAGTVGLLTVLALRAFTKAGVIVVVARHPHQAGRARQLGATEVVAPGGATRTLRRLSGAFLARPETGPEFLLGGVDVAVDCTSGLGLDVAMRTVRAGGTVVAAGLTSGSADLTPVWCRELNLVGAYASTASDFRDALRLVDGVSLTDYVDAVYPLHRWTDAMSHAMSAGRLGSTKVAFDPRLG
ncbi:zinc-dependent alcohol dehydrogenase [Micromonospora zamorensis]|uniref:zinc-dependent alcohol dehydrogenase n=1 Tax=Micromonospora zamorensis TaxID=709883 RepID=UPI003D972967